MKTIDPGRSVLVLVDYQAKLMPAIDRGAQVVAEGVRLADAARLLGIPVLGTEQNPRGLGPNVEAIRSRCGETLAKNHFDGCRDGLVDAVRRSVEKPLDVVVAGCEAHVCLMQSALGLLRAGFSVFVVANACGSRSAADHDLAMRRLAQSGATLASAEMVIFEWLRTSEHPKFRQMLQLVR